MSKGIDLPGTTPDGHHWHLMINVPKHEIVGRFVDGSERRVRATWRRWIDGETGERLDISPIRWRYMIEELDI